jgi:predicted dehydrogenase
MTTTIRWGILGTGNIAKKFATGLATVPNAALAAVGSRSRESADAFAEKFSIPRRHASYEALAADPDIDVVYVSTPHPMHKANALLCLEAGKAVLCEKPFTLNAADTAEVVATARRKRRFLMEAMWTRFLPAIAKARELLREGAIGETRLVQADFGFRTGVKAESRLFDLALGGGALLDVGIYPISFASMIYGRQPTRIDAQATIGTTGVDEQTAMLFGYDGGASALLSTAIRINTPQDAYILGTDGHIQIPTFWKADKLTVKRGANTETLALPFIGNGYSHQAIEVQRCLREGLLESPTMPHDESIAIMATMDQVRARIGLKYPQETQSQRKATP